MSTVPQIDPALLAAAVKAARLPEAPASMNLRLALHGHEVLFTLRDTDEYRLLSRLEALLTHLAAATPAPPSGGNPPPTGSEASNGAGPQDAAGGNPPPAPASPPLEQRVDWCATHGTAMAKHEHNGSTCYSHKTPEGWCKGGKPKAADIPF